MQKQHRPPHSAAVCACRKCLNSHLNHIICCNHNPGSGDYTQIDPELIREYPDHMRADIPGLSAGEYIVKVVPVANGVEDERSAAETDVLSVMAYTREGFAFSEQSPAKDASGGYNPDGTPKQNADIIYIS